MNILVITGSPRRGANTETMAEAFAESARTSGHNVIIKRTSELKIAGCLGCQYCFEHDGECVQKDDMGSVLEVLDTSDMVVFASPIYYFGLTAQLHAVIHRFYARLRKGYHVTKAALLLVSGSPDVYSAAEVQFNELTKRMKWENKGILKFSGMREKDSMALSPEIKKVREFAQSLTD